jgi:broad specificity phosphatase PhoE
MDIYLIRHTSVDVPEGTCYGQTDVPTRDTFEEEASLTKAKLAGMTFDKVFTSPLTRARKLAAYCGYPDAVADERLMEMDMGDWEMQKFDEIKDANPAGVVRQLSAREKHQRRIVCRISIDAWPVSSRNSDISTTAGLRYLPTAGCSWPPVCLQVR